MTRSTPRRLIGTTLLAVAACAEPVSTAPDLVASAPEPLEVALPTLETGHRIDTTRVRLGDSIGSWVVPRPADGEDQPVTIRNEHTNVGFFPGEAYAEGSHEFSGQVGRVETTANVAFDGHELGSQTAVAEKSTWLTLQIFKFVTAYAPVRTDHTCGLTVRGTSLHSAWAQLFQLKSAPNFGRAETSTYGGPASQEDCDKIVSNTDPTGRHSESDGIVCTYLITYDRETLEVVHVELLYCRGFDDDDAFI